MHVAAAWISAERTSADSGAAKVPTSELARAMLILTGELTSSTRYPMSSLTLFAISLIAIVSTGGGLLVVVALMHCAVQPTVGTDWTRPSPSSRLEE